MSDNPISDATTPLGPTERLFKAIRDHDAAAVKGAIVAGADLKQKESTVFLPLELAITLSTAPVVEELLAAGCSTSDRSFSGVMLADSALVKLDDPYVTETEKDSTCIPSL